jgi:uncharacterized membrane protein SpoIIM required for sporulation
MRKLQPRDRWAELNDLLNRATRQGAGGLSVAELKRVCHLYRQVTIDLSRARAEQADPRVVVYLNHLAARAHGFVYGSRKVDLRGLFTFVTNAFPRAARRQWRVLLVSAFVFLATSLASFFAVLHNPELAYSLFDENIVEFENLRLERQSGEYKGNFTFSASDSPLMAVLIIVNNIRVAMMAFALGALLCLPGVLILTYNGRMLGTLSGMLWNHGYFVDFYGLILTHGVLELTAICISGGSGLLLGWSLIAPGNLTRGQALKNAARDGFALLAGSVLILVIAGIIEAYVTPHFPANVRWTTAGLSALFLIAYLGLAGRQLKPAPASQSPGND